MAIVLTNIAQITTTTTATLALAVPAGGVPAGALIVVAVCMNSQAGSDSVADAASNSYTVINRLNYNSTFSRISAHYAWNANALTSGQNITWTSGFGAGGTYTASAFYATGIQTTSDPRDTATGATAINAGNTAPGATLAAVPLVASSLVMCVFGADAPVADTFTQDSTHAAYQNFPVRQAITSGNNRAVAGGAVVSSAQLQYAATITSRPWGAMITAFKAAIGDILMAQACM